MRICFYSTDPEVAEIGSLLEGIEVTMASSLDEVQDCVNSSDEKLLLFIDLDGNKTEAEFVNSTLYEDTSVIRIIITAKASVKELKKHQLSEVSAYGYIKKPLTGKLVASLVNNFEIADYVEENDLLNEGDKAVEEAELTFVGVRSDLSGLSDSDIEEEEDEVFEAAPMQMPKPGDSADSDDDEDMDNILQFGSGDDEDVDGDQKTATDIQDAPDGPVKLSHEETKVLEKHGVLNESWKVTYESELNEKIQAKFDRVFSEGAGGLPDFEISEPTLERDDDDDFEENTNEAEVAAISLDFGGDDEEPSIEEISSVEMDLSDDEYLEESIKQDIVAPEPMVTEEATGEFEVAEMLADDDSSAEEINIQEPEQDSPQNSEVSMTDRDDEDDILDFNIPSEDDDELDLSGDGADDMSADSSTDGDLDLGDDMDLDLSDAEIQAANAAVDDGDDFDLDSMDLDDYIDVADVDDDLMGDMDLDAMDEEETNEVDSLHASDDEETAEVASLEGAEETDEVLDFGAGADDDEGIDDEATVATMLFSNDGATKEALDAARVPEDLSADESEDVDLASLLEEDDEDEELGFSIGEEEEDGMTETLLGASDEDDDHTGDATETFVSSGVDEDATQPTMVAHIPQRAQVATFTPASSDETIEITPPERRVASAYNEDELMRLQATIRQLREERDGLLKDINELKTEKKLVDQENLGLKAELDEVKIELTILKKRHQDEIEEMQYRIRLADEKKAISEEKSRQMQKEFDRLSQKVRIDFNQVKQREKELESQLELVTMDSESQVRSRDMKILELKRKIDQLEFNMENSAIKETKAREDKVKVEEKLAKIMKTLRGSIQVLEDDLELDEELIEKIKKV